MISKNITFILTFFLLSACSKQPLYEEIQQIPDVGWYADEPVSFLVDINDSISGFNFYLNIRNTGNYRYSNLYLFVDSHLPGGIVYRDTIECQIAAPDGKWLGSGFGDLYTQSVLFKRNVTFPATGSYKFVFTQAMRVESLQGISDFGISIENY